MADLTPEAVEELREALAKATDGGTFRQAPRLICDLYALPSETLIGTMRRWEDAAAISKLCRAAPALLEAWEEREKSHRNAEAYVLAKLATLRDPLTDSISRVAIEAYFGSPLAEESYGAYADLRAEHARLRKALEEISTIECDEDHDAAEYACPKRIARAALDEMKR